VPHAARDGAKRRAAEFVERMASSARFAVETTTGSSKASTRWLSVCREEQGARLLISVSHHRVQQRVHGGRQGIACAAADQTDARIDDGAVAAGNHRPPAIAIPGGARMSMKAACAEVSS